MHVGLGDSVKAGPCYIQWATKSLQCLVKLERLVIAGIQKMVGNRGNLELIEVLLSFNLSPY